MRKLYFALAALCCLLPVCVTAAETSTDIQTISVDQIHTGMKGVAYTVFEGVKPEPMDVEVLGILKNINGPRGDIILIRLHGKKVEYTGVVAGMSGSPVYIDGKLAGAGAVIEHLPGGGDGGVAFAEMGNHRREQGRQDADDGDDGQQLDEGEGA